MSWREIVTWDWVEFENGDRLHAVAGVYQTDDDECWADGLTICGREGRLWIQGC